MSDEYWDCPNSVDGLGHCSCWYDDEECCWCGAPAAEVDEGP